MYNSGQIIIIQFDLMHGKINLIAILLFSFFNSRAQQFTNTEWIEVKPIPAVSNGNNDPSKKSTSLRKYFFKKNTVLIAVDNRFIGELDYAVTGKILTIGKFVKFHIDTVDNEVLILSDINQKKNNKHKTDPAVFLSHNSIFEFLKETNQLHITGDSLIESNSQLSPTFYASLDSLFNYEVASKSLKKNINGSFIIDPVGSIKEIVFDPLIKIPVSDTENFKRTIMSTSGHWIMPVSEKAYYYRINFSLHFIDFSSFMGAGFTFNYPAP